MQIKLPDCIPVSAEDDEGSDIEFDDYGDPKPRQTPDENNLVAEQFLQLVVLQYFIMCVEIAINRMEDNAYGTS